MFTYAYVPANGISTETRVAAEMALAAARKELKLPMVRIKWFAKVEKIHNPYNPHAEGNPDVYGLGTFMYENDILGKFIGAEPDVICVMAGQSAEATKETVYHEVFHLWQFKQGFGFADHSEGLAQGYAEDALKRMRSYEEDEGTYLEHMTGKDWSVKSKAGAPIKAQQENAKAGAAAAFGGDGYYHKKDIWRHNNLK